MNTELKHYGVPGMKWGVRKGKSLIKKNTASKKQKDQTDKTKKGSKIAKRIIGGVLGAAGIATIGYAALVGKIYWDEAHGRSWHELFRPRPKK